MNIYQTILVALDLSKYSEDTLNKAKTMADKLGSTLYIIHVAEPFPMAAYPFIESYSSIEQQMLQEAIQKIHKRGEQYAVPETHQFIETGSPKTIILEKAQTINADLIIVGSHTKTTMATLLGSTATFIVNNASQDVLVINNVN